MPVFAENCPDAVEYPGDAVGLLLQCVHVFHQAGQTCQHFIQRFHVQFLQLIHNAGQLLHHIVQLGGVQRAKAALQGFRQRVHLRAGVQYLGVGGVQAHGGKRQRCQHHHGQHNRDRHMDRLVAQNFLVLRLDAVQLLLQRRFGCVGGVVQFLHRLLLYLARVSRISNQNVLPCPTALFTPKAKPCCCKIALVMLSPSPVPLRPESCRAR